MTESISRGITGVHSCETARRRACAFHIQTHNTQLPSSISWVFRTFVKSEEIWRVQAVETPHILKQTIWKSNYCRLNHSSVGLSVVTGSVQCGTSRVRATTDLIMFTLHCISSLCFSLLHRSLAHRDRQSKKENTEQSIFVKMSMNGNSGVNRKS